MIKNKRQVRCELSSKLVQGKYRGLNYDRYKEIIRGAVGILILVVNVILWLSYMLGKLRKAHYMSSNITMKNK